MAETVKGYREGPGGEWRFEIGPIDGKPVRYVEVRDPQVDVRPVNAPFQFLRRKLFSFADDNPSITFTITLHDAAVTSFFVSVYVGNRGDQATVEEVTVDLLPEDNGQAGFS